MVRFLLIFLCLASLAGVAAALSAPELEALLPPAAICAAVSFALLAISRLRRKPALAKRRGQVVVDGSNVMYWRGGEPSLETVREVIWYLSARGFEVGVMFDANAGYLVSDRYRHHGDFARLLGIPESHVMVAPKGTPADQHILTAARDLDARVVSNDRFRDWMDAFPEIRRPGRVVSGGFASGRLALDFGEEDAAA